MSAALTNQEIVLDFLEAFATYDPDKFLPFMTDDPTWRVFQNERRGPPGHCRPGGHRRQPLPDRRGEGDPSGRVGR